MRKTPFSSEMTGWLDSALSIVCKYGVATFNKPRHTVLDKVNSCVTVTGKFSIMIRTLLYIFDSRESHSEPTKEMYIPLRLIPKGDTLWLFV